MTAIANPDLTRDEITHRVLALCAETDAIAIHYHPLGLDERFSLRGQTVLRRHETALRMALTALHAAGLIVWYDDRNVTGTQYAEETPAGKATLLRWDAELFGGAL